jgi:hypothetical protein
MHEENRFNRPNDRAAQDQQRQPGGRTSLRGCWELLIKLIILLILIAILLAYWFGQLGPFGPRGEYNPWAWLTLLLLIILLIYLIWRQKHFVMLNCGLTQPTGCKHGDPNILAGHVLEPIIGTASGIGFNRYELELVYGSTTLPAGIIYADNVGNPAPALTFGNHQVTSGTLGFVDVQQAVIGAGSGVLTSSSFEVRLKVIGIDSSSHTCNITFEIAAARSYIKKVGAAYSHTYINPNEQLCRTPPPVVHAVDPTSIGGGVYVRGAANVYGCAAELISKVQVWEIPDPAHSFPQPANGTPPAAPAGGTLISEVIYTSADQRDNNPLNGLSTWGDILTYEAGWTVREECVTVDFGFEICWTVPDIVEKVWSTPASGKYSLLLIVLDNVGNTYYDVQRIWVDNFSPIAQIKSIGGLAPCVDLRLSLFVGTTAEIRGVAWDPPIVGDPLPVAPDENFGDYSMSFQKNGGAGGGITVATPGVRVPNVWPGPLGAVDGVLANWDIVAALDFGAPGPVPPGSPKLGRGERCAYVIFLSVSDKTLVGEGPSHNHAPHAYAINIINDIGP